MKLINEEFVCYEDYPKRIKVNYGKEQIIVKGLLNIYTDEGVFDVEINRICEKK